MRASSKSIGSTPAAHAASLEASVGPQEARDQRGIGARLAEAQVRVLAHGYVCVGEERPSARGLGHVGHEADRSDDALVNGSGDAEVDGVRVAEVVGADEQLFHGLLSRFSR